MDGIRDSVDLVEWVVQLDLKEAFAGREEIPLHVEKERESMRTEYELISSYIESKLKA
jgi:hypothetical protein